MRPLRAVVVSLWVLGVFSVPAALAGNCTAPETLGECSQECPSYKACLRCCSATRAAVSTCRSECTGLLSADRPRNDPSVGGDPQSPTRRPPRPARPARPVRTLPNRQPPGQPAPAQPTINPAGFSATCSLDQAGDRLWVRLRVKNNAGVALATVAAQSPRVQIEAGTQLSMPKAPIPRAYSTLAAGDTAEFRWQGRLRLGGAVGISTAVSALAPNGATLTTPQIDCGTIGGSEPDPQPEPEIPANPPHSNPPNSPNSPNPPSGAATAEAAQCANCHESPHMAFVANMWLESGHASTNGRGRDNTFCANCHSPLQADARASAAQNTTIPASQWQGVTCSACHPSDEEGAGWNTPIGTYNVATRSHSPVPLGDADVLCTRCHTGEFAPGFQGYGDYMNFAGVRCIDCHMPKIPSGDPAIGERVAHNFKVAANLPYSCGTVPGGCHARRPTSWAVRILELGPMHTRGHGN